MWKVALAGCCAQFALAGHGWFNKEDFGQQGKAWQWFHHHRREGVAQIKKHLSGIMSCAPDPDVVLDLRRQLEANEDERRHLSSKVRSAEQRLEALRRRSAMCRKLHRETRGRMREAFTQSQQCEAALQTSSKRVPEERQRFKDLLSELQTERALSARLESEGQELRQRLQVEVGEKASLTKDKDECEELLDTEKNTLALLQFERRDLELQIRAKTAETTRLEREIEEMRLLWETGRNLSMDMEREKKDLEHRLQESLQVSSGLAQQLSSALTKEASESKDEVAYLRQQLEAKSQAERFKVELQAALGKSEDIAQSLQAAASARRAAFLDSEGLGASLFLVLATSVCWFAWTSRLKGDMGDVQVSTAASRLEAESGSTSTIACEADEFPSSVLEEKLNEETARFLQIRCPGVNHRDVAIDIITNGCIVTIHRQASRGVQPTTWSKQFQFPLSEGLFEFKEEQALLENGLLQLVFVSYIPINRTFRFPEHFSLAAADAEEAWLRSSSTQGRAEALEAPAVDEDAEDELPPPVVYESTAGSEEFEIVSLTRTGDLAAGDDVDDEEADGGTLEREDDIELSEQSEEPCCPDEKDGTSL